MATLPPPTSPEGTPEPTGLNADVLAACLRNGARHDRNRAAAVGLLLDYGHWLTNPAFVEHCVSIVSSPEDGYPVAVVAWPAAKTFVYLSGTHGSPESVLLWACELARHDTRVPAVQLLARMDDRAARLAIAAAKHTSCLHTTADADESVDVLGEVA